MKQEETKNDGGLKGALIITGSRGSFKTDLTRERGTVLGNEKIVPTLQFGGTWNAPSGKKKNLLIFTAGAPSAIRKGTDNHLRSYLPEECARWGGEKAIRSGKQKGRNKVANLTTLSQFQSRTTASVPGRIASMGDGAQRTLRDLEKGGRSG